ncbi:MAG TPA: hypothetical protein VNW06_07530, partial [Cytophagaceae bacterium]|nr:hypothetical protein [Cytophagaceae bacterium]
MKYSFTSLKERNMLTEQDAQELMIKLIKLREEVKNSDNAKLISELKAHENICIEKFKYLVFMRTSRYKAFSNYDDLNQEGFEALIKAMKNYQPSKGSWFWWAHKYIDTRISRSANLHTTIRFPLKVAKANAPHKESVLPLLIEERYCPDKELEHSQTLHSISSAMKSLTEEQRNIVALAYGFDGDKPLSIN